MSEVNIARIAENIKAVKEQIKRVADRSGRDPEGITLVAVSKMFPAEVIEAAVAAGVADIGESRVQEGTDKIKRLGKIARWHMIGHLQSNKAAAAVRHFDMIQSIDSIRLAEKVSQQTVRYDKTIDCLIEIKSSGEDSKYGFLPADALPAAEQIEKLPGINLCGLMTVGPWVADEGRVKKAFDLTVEIFEKTKDALGPKIKILSMGMSSDYRLAIECGSTMIRVGAAIFGERHK
jgi:pyridoxal phosphate enzyme (YggS family)